MDGTKAIGLLIVGVAVILLLLLAGAFAFGLISGSGSIGGQEKVKVECSGTIGVGLLGIGTADLKDDLRCSVDKCGFLPFSFFSVDSGTIRMRVDGAIVDTADWSSTIGENQQYTLRSGCLANATKVTIELLNDKGAIIDYKDRVIGG